jgi:hypothetical protein
LHGDLHLIDGTVETIELGGIGKGSTPLACTSFGRHIGSAFLLSIVALRNSGIDLMGAKRIGALVLEIDVGRGAECLFKRIGTY